MIHTLRIATWNANGLTNHTQEISLFLNINKIDILLISESHATNRTVIKIPNYMVYYANHPDERGHGGSAIIVKSSLKHHQLQPYTTDKIQSAKIEIHTSLWTITIAAIYSPPRHNITTHEYQHYFNTLGPRFIAAGDWNAKHTIWGSRLITQKGRTLLRAIQQDNLNYLSTGQPTYWPADKNKIPDLLDFAIIKQIPTIHCAIKSSFDLNSDHSPIIITVSTTILTKEPAPQLCTKKTNWDDYQEYINQHINLNIRLKKQDEIEKAVHDFTVLLQQAAWNSTPPPRQKPSDNNLPLRIKEMVQEKRRARRIWQHTRNPNDKRYLNRLTHKLHTTIQTFKNDTFAYYIKNMEPNDHTLWRATRTLKRPKNMISPLQREDGTWARSDTEKAQVYAAHLIRTFTPYDNLQDDEITNFLDSPCQLSPPIRSLTPTEVLSQIKLTNPHKTPGYDLITGETLKHLPRKAVVLLTTLFNRMLHLSYFPAQWKFAQIIMIPKPGKPPTEAASYRPISLLPLLSKIFERLLKQRITQITKPANLIPMHQFGFQEGHSTTHQCHRIVNLIREGLETKKICAAVFLDIQKAFDKVWHQGLLYKLKLNMPSQLYLLLQSYLSNRYFDIKINGNSPTYYPINAGVPQGSVLGPLLFLLYTADVPTTNETTIATFADDTAILALDQNPLSASTKVQNHLNILQPWLNKWKIRVNNDKSVHINFTTKAIETPQLILNDEPIPTKNEVKYLGLHLDSKLTWRPHIKAKRLHLNIKTLKMNWLLGRKSQLSLNNKLTIYKVILKPIWTYAIELWGCAKPTNIRILQNYQSKLLRTMTNAPWYVSNRTLHDDLNVPYITEVLHSQAVKYRIKIRHHSNNLIQPLTRHQTTPRRLKRLWPEDLGI
jgi:hypothetical protein